MTPRPYFLIAALVAWPAHGEPLTREDRTLTHAGAQAVLQAAEQAAQMMKAPSAIAVVNQDGGLLAFDRMDEVRPGSADLAIGKARTAALLQRPTEEVEENVAKGRVGLATAGFTALRGGTPLVIDGAVVGAIGVAGRDKEMDATIAKITAEHFATLP
ncbi:MAG: heme-binding protein [Caulobacteraceae bacterium]|nr:heme-binding protein [Caulobacteraceae bacterium]